MIQHHIERDLKEHVSVISSFVIETIEENDEMVLERCMKLFLKKYQYYSPNQFMDALVFLFCINAIEIENFKVRLKYV